MRDRTHFDPTGKTPKDWPIAILFFGAPVILGAIDMLVSGEWNVLEWGPW